MPKSLNFRCSEGWYFLNCDNTELKRSSKINFSVCKQHRWAEVGWEPITFTDESAIGTLLIELRILAWQLKIPEPCQKWKNVMVRAASREAALFRRLPRERDWCGCGYGLLCHQLLTNTNTASFKNFTWAHPLRQRRPKKAAALKFHLDKLYRISADLAPNKSTTVYGVRPSVRHLVQPFGQTWTTQKLFHC